MRHEGTTEKLKEVTETQEIKETESQELTEIINEMTRDASTIIGETKKLGHEGITEIINEVTEIEEIEGDELHETEQGHTQVELVRDNGVELVECIGTWCEYQDSLP